MIDHEIVVHLGHGPGPVQQPQQAVYDAVRIGDLEDHAAIVDVHDAVGRMNYRRVFDQRFHVRVVHVSFLQKWGSPDVAVGR